MHRSCSSSTCAPPAAGRVLHDAACTMGEWQQAPGCFGLAGQWQECVHWSRGPGGVQHMRTIRPASSGSYFSFEAARRPAAGLAVLAAAAGAMRCMPIHILPSPSMALAAAAAAAAQSSSCTQARTKTPPAAGGGRPVAGAPRPGGAHHSHLAWTSSAPPAHSGRSSRAAAVRSTSPLRRCGLHTHWRRCRPRPASTTPNSVT
jgi:hypothetical protein